jgi:hypothetical protein
MTEAAPPPPDARQPVVNEFGILTGYVLGAIVWAGCFAIAVQIGLPTGDASFNLLISFFGSIVGWAGGMLLTPDPAEAEEFKNFQKAISAFLSGFVLAKLDGLLRGADSRRLAQVLLFGTTFLICLLFTYVGRRYRLKRGPESLAVERWIRAVSAVVLVAAAAGFVWVNYLRALPTQANWLLLGVLAGGLALLGLYLRQRFTREAKTAMAAESPGTSAPPQAAPRSS